jgi:hypothetical protein
MELLLNFWPRLGRLKGGTFCLSLLLSLFLKSIRENMILWFFNIRHSGTLFVVPHFGSTNVPFHPTLQRLNMWSSWVKRKGTTQVLYIAKLKDGPKRGKKTFSMILEMFFKMVWWRGRKWNHIKKDLWSWSVFLLSKYWLPLLFDETLGAFFLFSIFHLLRTWGFYDIWGENQFFKNLFSNGMT